MAEFTAIFSEVPAVAISISLKHRPTKVKSVGCGRFDHVMVLAQA